MQQRTNKPSQNQMKLKSFRQRGRELKDSYLHRGKKGRRQQCEEEGRRQQRGGRQRQRETRGVNKKGLFFPMCQTRLQERRETWQMREMTL